MKPFSWIIREIGYLIKVIKLIEWRLLITWIKAVKLIEGNILNFLNDATLLKYYQTDKSSYIIYAGDEYKLSK